MRKREDKERLMDMKEMKQKLWRWRNKKGKEKPHSRNQILLDEKKTVGRNGQHNSQRKEG